MACPDFFSDLSISRYNSLIWIGAVGCDHTMWLSELRTFAMFWDLKSYSIVETDILWYDLRDYICYFQCNACIFSSSVTWPSLTSIMNYPLCMTHNLATVNRYEHAWTDNWAQNICKLSMLVFPMQLRSDGRQHGTRGRLYATKVKWKNYLACFPLLGMGLMIVLRRAGW